MKILLLALLPALVCAEEITTDLLANDSLALWQHGGSEKISSAWVLKDGILHLDKKSGKGGGDLVTKKSYQNFELRFQWKISEKGNSGVKYRTKKGLGLEYQVLDDGKHKDAQKPNHRTASFYDLLAAPDDKPLKPVGEWNSACIVANENRLEHWLNGKKVAELEFGSADWQTRFQKSKYRKSPDFASQAGPLLLQDHGDDVWFRNIRIKEL